jgi:16S rRNA (adenine1518-N6/adenine1519-N6)-dimethyltransferase
VTRETARLRAKKKFGQHFLQGAWADKVVSAIAPQAVDRFIEIGPGPGALTLRLAPRVAHLTAVEVDAAMIEMLRPKVGGNVTLIHADFLEVDLTKLEIERPFRVVGNLPYNVSSPILFALLRSHVSAGSIIDATLMVQREVAERICAVPGTRDYGVLSILVQLHAGVRRVLALPPGAFRPAPKVHSAVIHVRFRAPAVPVGDGAVFEAMVRSMFTQRRKTLLNALRPFAAARRRDVAAALASAGIEPTRRPETLQLTELADLAEQFR